jgi:hypothetical protein
MWTHWKEDLAGLHVGLDPGDELPDAAARLRCERTGPLSPAQTRHASGCPDREWLDSYPVDPLRSAIEAGGKIRTWRVSERIEPVELKTIVGRGGLGFEISFRREREAERFQDRFGSLLT